MNRIELETVHRLIQDLNYYQILKISPIAGESDIREAFHREALLFHPDQYFSNDDKETQRLAKEIYSHIVQAYQTLMNRKKRSEYDANLNNQSRVILKGKDTEEFEDAVTDIKFKTAMKSPGEKFFKLAEQAYKAQDYKSALMNIQIAIGSEPQNSRFLNFKNRIESLIKPKA